MWKRINYRYSLLPLKYEKKTEMLADQGHDGARKNLAFNVVSVQAAGINEEARKSGERQEHGWRSLNTSGRKPAMALK